MVCILDWTELVYLFWYSLVYLLTSWLIYFSKLSIEFDLIYTIVGIQNYYIIPVDYSQIQRFTAVDFVFVPWIDKPPIESPLPPIDNAAASSNTPLIAGFFAIL